jgi:hypothetical protein
VSKEQSVMGFVAESSQTKLQNFTNAAWEIPSLKSRPKFCYLVKKKVNMPLWISGFCFLFLESSFSRTSASLKAPFLLSATPPASCWVGELCEQDSYYSLNASYLGMGLSTLNHYLIETSE